MIVQSRTPMVWALNMKPTVEIESCQPSLSKAVGHIWLLSCKGLSGLTNVGRAPFNLLGLHSLSAVYIHALSAHSFLPTTGLLKTSLVSELCWSGRLGLFMAEVECTAAVKSWIRGQGDPLDVTRMRGSLKRKWSCLGLEKFLEGIFVSVMTWHGSVTSWWHGLVVDGKRDVRRGCCSAWVFSVPFPAICPHGPCGSARSLARLPKQRLRDLCCRPRGVSVIHYKGSKPSPDSSWIGQWVTTLRIRALEPLILILHSRWLFVCCHLSYFARTMCCQCRYLRQIQLGLSSFMTDR